MKIKVLFERVAQDDCKRKFATGWGLSYLLGDDLLFDTGEKFEYLARNAELMNVDLKKITKVFISHEHWDHTGGLWDLLEMNNSVTVYGCSRFSNEFKDKVAGFKAEFVETSEKHVVKEGVHSLGETLGNYKGKIISEQALIIDGEKLTVLCGCAHPSLQNILEKARMVYGKDIGCSFGGFHLMDKDKRFAEYIVSQAEKLTDKIGISHCTGHEAENLIVKYFNHRCFHVQVGMEIDTR
ncbi:MAG: MBL fold metallo-hydrolase [Candidatus Omnitrophota bacterium]